MSRPIELDYSSRRSPEAIALFNVAFTSEILVNSCWAKGKEDNSGLSWPATFCILPLVLHPTTREKLPRDRRITLARWAVKNPDLLADMEYRFSNMVLPTKRAIRHGLRSGRLEIDGTNLVATGTPRHPKPEWPEEIREVVKAARICGKWFHGIDTHMAFELLGIGG